MHAENAVVMKATPEAVFRVAADLSLWPKILPHYRWVRYLKTSPEKNVVVMAARRKWIPIKWTSEQEIDPKKMEVRFHHLKAFTKGMRVVWTFTPTEDGVRVQIRHDLESRIPLVGKFIAEYIIGRFFIHYVANQTLTHMKRFVEQQDDP